MKNEKVLDSIAEGSALLAEFMGVKEIESSYDSYGQPMPIWYAGYLGYRTPAFSVPNKSIEHLLNENKFNTSWEWLMPVINRISDHIYEEIEEDNGLEKRIIKDRAYPRTFGMISQEGKYMFRFNRQCLFEGDTLIEAAFSACVDFVTWLKSCGGAIESKTSHETTL